MLLYASRREKYQEKVVIYPLCPVLARVNNRVAQKTLEF